MSITTYVHDIVQAKLHLCRDDNPDGLHSLILCDNEGNEVECKFHNSRFYSFINELRNAITEGMIEYRIKERMKQLEEQNQPGKDPRMSMTLADLADNAEEKGNNNDGN